MQIRKANCWLLAGLGGMLLLSPAGGREIAWRQLVLDGHPVRWHAAPRERLTLAWQILSSPAVFDDAINCSQMTTPADLLSRSGISMEVFRTELAAAFQMWERAAGISFVEAQPGQRVDIAIGAQLRPEGRAFADVAYDRSAVSLERPIVRSLVCLNPQVRWKAGFDGNLDIYDLRFTFAHEIGHAIGLDHPRHHGALMWFGYNERSRELADSDIEGAVALYGPREETQALRAGAAGAPDQRSARR